MIAVGQTWRNRQSGYEWRVAELLRDEQRGTPLARLARDGSMSPPPISVRWIHMAYEPIMPPPPRCWLTIAEELGR